MNPDLEHLQKIDPLKRQEESTKEDRGEGLSPMGPPDAYDPAKEQLDMNQAHPFLRNLMVEHQEFLGKINQFEEALEDIKKTKKISNESQKKMSAFFRYFDLEFMEHNRLEEKKLFPLLSQRFLEVGEHAPTKNPITPVDIMVDEHLEAIQLGTVCFNFLGLFNHIPDEKSKSMVLDLSLQKGMELAALLKLHIFREDSFIFGLAQKHLTTAELDAFLS